MRKICAKLEAPNVRGLTTANKLLNQAFQFFLQQSMGETGAQIAVFIERLSFGMVFTRIVVQDDLNAYKVFETLNARGVRLSTPDLLKNHLFSMIARNDDVPDNELNELDILWGEIVTQSGETDFSHFIRCHHNLQAKLATKKDLFASVRQLTDSPSRAYAYLDSLSQCAPVYASLANPDDDWWINQPLIYRQARKYLGALRLFAIKQPFTILLTAFFSFSPEEFVKLCRYIMALSIRYNVICRLSPGEQENKYNQIAIRIYEKEFKRAGHVKNSELFKELYPDDKTFFNAFEFHKIPSRQMPKKIRFLLAQIENSLGNTVDEMNVSLEHICPYNLNEAWINDFGEGEVQDRLGNMVLLPRQENKALNTQAFSRKKEIYAQSGFKLAAKVAEYEQWNKQAVDDFQHWMSRQAVLAWRID